MMPKFKFGDNVIIRTVKTTSFNDVETIEEVIPYEDGTIYKLLGDSASYEEYELEKYEVETSLANKLREKSEAVLRAKREEEDKRVQERLGAIVEHIVLKCEEQSDDGKFEASFEYSLFSVESEDKYLDSNETDVLLLETVARELKKEGFEIIPRSISGKFLVKW